MTNVKVEIDFDGDAFPSWKVGDTVTIRYLGGPPTKYLVVEKDLESGRLELVEAPPVDVLPKTP